MTKRVKNKDTGAIELVENVDPEKHLVMRTA